MSEPEVMNSASSFDCFISYASADLALAEELYYRLRAEGLKLARACTPRDAVQKMSVLLAFRSEAQERLGRLDKAITDRGQSITIAEESFQNAEWHWYLRHSLAGGSMQLAKLYEKRGEIELEVETWRKYLRLWLGPMQGMDVGPLLKPGRPANLAEARTLRDFNAKSPGMKRLTVPCDFNGVKYPYYIFITDLPAGTDPLADQARRLKEQRGGTIPTEVLDAFNRLHKIAVDNKVSFQHLCVYAPGSAAENEKKDAKTP